MKNTSQSKEPLKTIFPKSMSFHAPIILIIISLLFLVNVTVSDPRATKTALICSNRTAVQSSLQVYMANYIAAMESVSIEVYMHGYGAVAKGSHDPKIYAFADCMRDLSRDDCVLCMGQCKVQIHNCLPFQNLVLGGRIYSHGCFLGYDDHRFSGFDDGGVVCDGGEVGGDENERSLFRESVLELVRNLGEKGPKNDGFLVGSVENKGDKIRVYGLVQCWRFGNGSDCRGCLDDLVLKVGSCLPKEEGMFFNSGCYLRYSTKKFYNDSRSNDSTSKYGGDKYLAIIFAGTSAAVAIVLFVATISFFLRKRFVKHLKEKEQLDYLATVTKSKLIFSYETLEKATQYFHDSNKLGEGGSGHVYKGKLPDGRTVAIKRILFDTKQWAENFFNEVNLVSGINHKNHVKLLGYSVTGPESLLVFEHMPNQSLHDYFAKKNVKPLKWELRYKIILGAAEGLAHLHEESSFRIIHRDIKLSNILLDEDFTPKIADFGLARLFPEDNTYLTSIVAGTFGYMAPEYVTRGKLSEKADVYSFGVVIIEVVSGRLNSAFSENVSPIVQTVWKLYKEGQLCEAIDPLLRTNFEEAATRMLKIGLLCTQTSADLRPSMSKIVKMIINNNQEIPHPTQPPFLKSSYLEAINTN